MHYRDPGVRAVLTRLMEMPQLRESWRAYIRSDMLTGRAKWDYIDYLEQFGRKAEE